jgi:hypothetical protein
MTTDFEFQPSEIVERHTCANMDVAHRLTPEGVDHDYFMCSSIYSIVRSDVSGWLAIGDERGTSIFFCPFCGQRLI